MRKASRPFFGPLRGHTNARCHVTGPWMGLDSSSDFRGFGPVPRAHRALLGELCKAMGKICLVLDLDSAAIKRTASLLGPPREAIACNRHSAQTTKVPVGGATAIAVALQRPERSQRPCFGPGGRPAFTRCFLVVSCNVVL
jgi:hypothetical protein